MRKGLGHLIALWSAFSALAMYAAADPARQTADPFASLVIYDGTWDVRAAHPWSGSAVGAVARLSSRCQRFTVYFACEQTVNGTVNSLIVYSATDLPGHLNTRTIAPNGLAGGRGDLTLAGSQWTYLDKPPASLKGDWSRTENFILDHDHIRFEEYASSDEGKTWRLTNSGQESRRHS